MGPRRLDLHGEPRLRSDRRERRRPLHQQDAHRRLRPRDQRHNPPPYYTKLPGCSQFDVPYKQLPRDLDADTLPAFAFITPNMCNNMHNCAVGTGDAWLSHAVGRLVASAAYQRGDMAIFVTFDEGEKGGSDNCTFNTHDGGCHIATVVISPSTPPGTRSHLLFNHYSLLRTTEEMLGIDTFLGKAKTATSMRAAFNL